MGRLSEAVKALRLRGEKIFVPYLTSGDPSLELTRKLWHALDRAGADIIEIGIPFSDPLADGPTIQRASQRALKTGTTLAGVLEALASERASLRASTIVFSYLNPILAMGVEEFVSRADRAGADGVLVPDLILEEAAPLRDALSVRNIDLVQLIAPTTSDARMELIGRSSEALVYAVSVAGVTGARAHIDPGLGEFITRAKKCIQAPIVIGFGISNPEQAFYAARLADGVVVGSALVDIVEKAGTSHELPALLERFAGEFARAVKSA